MCNDAERGKGICFEISIEALAMMLRDIARVVPPGVRLEVFGIVSSSLFSADETIFKGLVGRELEYLGVTKETLGGAL